MKKIVITLLICLNVGLLAALMFGQAASPAHAQTGYYNETNYAMVAGKIESGYEVVYVIDLASQQIGIWKFNLSTRRLMAMPGRSLATDFRGRD